MVCTANATITVLRQPARQTTTVPDIGVAQCRAGCGVGGPTPWSIPVFELRKWPVALRRGDFFIRYRSFGT